MIDKTVASVTGALSGLSDGATVMVSGFGLAGQPRELIDGLLERGARDLVIISNNAGSGDVGLAALLKEGRVRKIVCSFPRQTDSWVFDELYRGSRIELELVPQGDLAERIRAAGAGIPAFYSPTAYGTQLAEGAEVRQFNGVNTVMKTALHADFALVKAHTSDTWGNLVYRKTARNFGPVMLSAARIGVVQVGHIVSVGDLDPETVVTPGIFVDRIHRVAGGSA